MQVSQLRHWSVTTSSASSVRPLDPSVCLCVNASGCVKELLFGRHIMDIASRCERALCAHHVLKQTAPKHILATSRQIVIACRMCVQINGVRPFH